MEGRIEPEPALHGKIGRHPHIGDKELVLEALAHEVEAEHGPDRRARSVAGDDELRLEPVRPIRRLHRQPRPVIAALDGHDAVEPAQVDAERERAVDQMLLDVILLEVDEGGHACARPPAAGRSGRAARRAGRPCRRSSARPSPAWLGAAQPVEDLQRALGEADGARALADPVAVVEQHAVDAAQLQVDRQREPDRAGADDDDRVARGRAATLVGMRGVGEAGEGLGVMALGRTPYVLYGVRCEGR